LAIGYDFVGGNHGQARTQTTQTTGAGTTQPLPAPAPTPSPAPNPVPDSANLKNAVADFASANTGEWGKTEGPTTRELGNNPVTGQCSITPQAQSQDNGRQ